MLKITPRRQRQQARKPACDQQAAASFAPSSSVAANAYVIHPPKTKHGPRQHFVKQEFAQAAIAALYPNGGLPERSSPKLVRLVNKKLEGRYRVSRQTVMRALEALHAANR